MVFQIKPDGTDLTSQKQVKEMLPSELEEREKDKW
jgi:hypothetical protein